MRFTFNEPEDALTWTKFQWINRVAVLGDSLWSPLSVYYSSRIRLHTEIVSVIDFSAVNATRWYCCVSILT